MGGNGLLTKSKNRKINSLWFTLLLIVALMTVSLLASLRIEAIVEENCFQILNDTVEQGAISIRSMLENGEQQIATVADMLSGHGTLTVEACQMYLDDLRPGGLISAYAILLPDGQMVYSNENVPRMDAAPSFAAESRGPLRFVSRYGERDGEYYAAYLSPIANQHAVSGVLYGFVRLSELPETLSFSAFDGQCQLYLVDGGTGDFLMDTWHDTLTNMYDEYLANRKTKLGTSFEQMRRDVENETAGFVVFESRSVGEDFYSCYYPVGKYHLSFQVTVLRPIAFAAAIRIQKIVFILGITQFVAAMGFVLLLLRRVKQRSREDQKKLAMNRALNEVQQILFGVYKSPYLLDVALERLGHAVDAEQIVLMLLNDGIVENIFTLHAIDEQKKEHMIGTKLPDAVLQDIRALPDEKGRILTADNDRERLEQARAMPGLQGAEKVRSIAAVWALNSDKAVIGLMYAVNVTDPESVRTVLSTAISSFQMAVQTLATYNMLHLMGEFDALTGLKNRNAYQKYLDGREHEQAERLCCIYLDANGLHEMNNRFGHASGDRMLSSIGAVVRELFGSDTSYRIGGDEFVLFCSGLDERMVRDRIQRLQSRLEQLEYYLSIGLAFRRPGQSIQQLIANAEHKMYEWKKEFYTGDRRSTRQHNQDLESALMAKQDQDSFLSAISANYLGVYVVNLDTDISRAIYKPNYFDELLKQTDYLYQQALREYAKLFVADGDYAAFIDFLDYGRIEEMIQAGHILERCYQKKNGDTVRVRILTMKGYSAAQKDTLWIFERYSAAQG